MTRVQWMFGIGLAAVITLQAATLIVLVGFRSDIEFIASIALESPPTDTNMSGPID